MVCDFCKRDSAEHHFMTIKRNEIVTIHLCRSCKQDMNLQEKTEGLENNFDHLLDSLIHPRDSFNQPDFELSCKRCGTTLKDFKRTSYLGCAECYNLFAQSIAGNQSREEARSRGRLGKGSSTKTLALLRKDLREAVRLENFEKAAEIRDRIRSFEEDIV